LKALETADASTVALQAEEVAFQNEEVRDKIFAVDSLQNMRNWLRYEI
jgi:hypothetical protein